MAIQAKVSPSRSVEQAVSQTVTPPPLAVRQHVSSTELRRGGADGGGMRPADTEVWEGGEGRKEHGKRDGCHMSALCAARASAITMHG